MIKFIISVFFGNLLTIISLLGLYYFYKDKKIKKKGVKR